MSDHPTGVNALFERREVWNQYDATGEIARKLPLVERLIPAEVASLVDVGCGNGLLTGPLARTRRVVGIDLSLAALKAIALPAPPLLCASADRLPLADRSFDLAFTSEMLEHLPNGIYEAALTELARVARRYVLITVPNNENLSQLTVRCPSCSERFHAYLHLRSFSQSGFAGLIPGFRLRDSFTGGPVVRRQPDWLVGLKQNVGQFYDASRTTTVCPACGNTHFPPPPRSAATRALNLTGRVVARRQAYWLFGLFERTNG